jgi:sterol desaturase/sphingolipid hydroxylase (fatty acid hydroxylase superfamily)
VFGWHAQGKETLALVALSAAHVPLLPVFPWFTGAVLYSAWNYYRVHKRSHLDPEWARDHLTWHYDHHMGPDPHANWCVTRPWFDRLLGTRKPYAFTEREARDRKRRAASSRRRSPGAVSAATPQSS